MSSFRPWRSGLLRTLGITVGLMCVTVGCHGAPDYPNCENDGHCNRDGHHGWCINGHCQECRTTPDCPSGDTCLRNRCVDGINACDLDGDCPASQRCDAHRCVPRTECDDSRPCSGGQVCTAGHCVAPPVEAPPVENRGPVCTLEAPTFPFDDNTLDGNARNLLQHDADCLQRERTSRYVLIGRCDPRGSTEYNLALGERRSRAVQRYLLSLGVLADRIAVSSEGSEGATGTDEAGWQHDRRVDFRLRP